MSGEAHLAARYLSEFFDLMLSCLIACDSEKEFFKLRRDKAKGEFDNFIEDPEVFDTTEKLTGEKGQIVVWTIYCMWDRYANTIS